MKKLVGVIPCFVRLNPPGPLFKKKIRGWTVLFLFLMLILDLPRKVGKWVRIGSPRVRALPHGIEISGGGEGGDGVREAIHRITLSTLAKRKTNNMQYSR